MSFFLLLFVYHFLCLMPHRIEWRHSRIIIIMFALVVQISWSNKRNVSRCLHMQHMFCVSKSKRANLYVCVARRVESWNESRFMWSWVGGLVFLCGNVAWKWKWDGKLLIAIENKRVRTNKTAFVMLMSWLYPKWFGLGLSLVQKHQKLLREGNVIAGLLPLVG